MTGGLGTGIIRSMVDNHLTVTTSEIIKVEEFPIVCFAYKFDNVKPGRWIC